MPARHPCLFPVSETHRLKWTLHSSTPQLKTLRLRERRDLSRVTQLVYSRTRIRPLGSGPSSRCSCLHHLYSVPAEDQMRSSEPWSSVSCKYLTRCDYQLGDSSSACPIWAGSSMYSQEMGPPDFFVIWPWSSVGKWGRIQTHSYHQGRVMAPVNKGRCIWRHHVQRQRLRVKFQNRGALRGESGCLGYFGESWQ